MTPQSKLMHNPGRCISLVNPDPARISTSYVGRQNLTMRMGTRIFTSLTNPRLALRTHGPHNPDNAEGHNHSTAATAGHRVDDYSSDCDRDG